MDDDAEMDYTQEEIDGAQGAQGAQQEGADLPADAGRRLKELRCLSSRCSDVLAERCLISTWRKGPKAHAIIHYRCQNGCADAKTVGNGSYAEVRDLTFCTRCALCTRCARVVHALCNISSVHACAFMQAGAFISAGGCSRCVELDAYPHSLGNPDQRTEEADRNLAMVANDGVLEQLLAASRQRMSGLRAGKAAADERANRLEAEVDGLRRRLAADAAEAAALQTALNAQHGLLSGESAQWAEREKTLWDAIPDKYAKEKEIETLLQSGRKENMQLLLETMATWDPDRWPRALELFQSGDRPAFVKYMNELFENVGLPCDLTARIMRMEP